MGLFRILFIILASLLVDVAGPVALSASSEVEELLEAEARHPRRPETARPSRAPARSPVPAQVVAATHRPPATVTSPRQPARWPRVLKVPALVADSPTAPEDH